MYWAGGCFVSWGFLCVVFSVAWEKMSAKMPYLGDPRESWGWCVLQTTKNLQVFFVASKTGGFQSKTWFLRSSIYIYSLQWIIMDLKHQKIRHFKRRPNRFGVPLNGPFTDSHETLIMHHWGGPTTRAKHEVLSGSCATIFKWQTKDRKLEILDMSWQVWYLQLEV